MMVIVIVIAMEMGSDGRERVMVRLGRGQVSQGERRDRARIDRNGNADQIDPGRAVQRAPSPEVRERARKIPYQEQAPIWRGLRGRDGINYFGLRD